MKKKIAYWMFIAVFSATIHAQETPTMGWSSWNTYRININEDLIGRQADAMVEKGLKDAGYSYINIDDGYFGGRDKDGNLLIHTERFPNGLKPLVSYIHGKGLKAGIYSDAGRNTCGSFWDGDKTGVGVGLYGHDQQDADLFFKDLKFDFIKVDFCGGDAGQNFDKLALSEEVRYKEIHEAILKTGRTDVRLNICRWAFPGTWAHEVASSWRISADINLSWGSVKYIIRKNMYLSAFAVDGKFNDMDMLEVGRGLSEEEDNTHFGMWCMMSSPLLIGCDMTIIPDQALDLLKNEELIALNQDALALQAYVVKSDEGSYVLVKDIKKLYGLTRAVALYNSTDKSRIISVSFSDLELGGKVRVRDTYKKTDIGVFSETFEVEVPAHGTRIYTLQADQRCERTIYEAETAWLSAFQDLRNNELSGTGTFREAAFCSGGAKASWLGKSEGNDLQWKNVYSIDGGDYDLNLAAISEEDRDVYISINGGEATKISVNTGSWNTVGGTTLKISLKKGLNTVRLFNTDGWMPDIDCMTLVKKNSCGL